MSASKLEYEQWLEFYREHAERQLLPFWRNAEDKEYGGVYTCFNNSGDRLLSRDKFTWSQGRFLWLWTRIASHCSRGLLRGEASSYIGQARKTFEFLERHAFLPDGSCSFLLSREGDNKEAIPGEGYDLSFYADCFVVIGYAEYARLTKNAQALDKAYTLYRHIERRLRSGTVRSEPYPVPPGYDAHGYSMIMLNTSQELANAMEELGDRRSPELRSDSRVWMEDIIFRFADGRDWIPELLPRSKEVNANTLLARHINPGHTIECMWFVIVEAQKNQRSDIVDRAAGIAANTLELGWDEQYGGLFRYVDREGGEPRGERAGDRFEQLVADTWNMKLWWPHSEALYTTLLCGESTRDARFYTMFRRLHDYVFRVFPNPDRSIGEWIQIRDHQGDPVDAVVALPVKDPYHILRNVLLIIELLDARLKAR
ncbi:MAG: N-acylglucosamine 2-epimerase (GlcNAc 2-epimerase) [Paenibacillaceae bacterium]|jgi:N-acylglucosamine 2-epimerase|nr:N-acylglucosamine 2-epimerase (GlcNAc 2-epimerase) [Paenibacillaceae bacterium]